ncbi:MAG: class III signal peptide-containing protein [Methanosphaera stadtmanae]|nr:class III signal peptide-containing protein [Methanosphaera stadtmanae]
MKIIADNNGQISAELILILSTMIMIVLITAYYTTNILNDITNHTQIVIKKGREMILSQL